MAHDNTGEIANKELLDMLKKQCPDISKQFVTFNIPLTKKQEKTNLVDLIDPCPCGSGKEFKECHYREKRF